MKPRVPRIPVVTTVSLLLLLTILTLWICSRRRAEVLMFYTPAGHLTGVASDRNGLLFCATEIPFEREMGLSAEAMSRPADEWAAANALLFDPLNVKWHRLGFRCAAGAFCPPWNWRFNALIVPYRAIVIPLAILPLTGLRPFFVRRRRARRRQCVACGYDLRQSPQRCPECGHPVAGRSAEIGTMPGLTSSPAGLTVGSALAWLVSAVVIAAIAAAFARGSGAATTAAQSPPEQAVFDRTVGPLDLADMPIDQGFGAIGRAAHTPVVVDWKSVDPDGALGNERDSLRLHDVRLTTALRLWGRFPRQGTNNLPVDAQAWTEGAAVRIGPSAAAPRFVRSYPVSDLLQRAAAEMRQQGDDLWQQGSAQGKLGSSYFESVSATFTPVADELSGLIQDTVRTGDWVDRGGTLNGILVVGGRMWVYQSQAGHAAVRDLLAALRTPPAADPITQSLPACADSHGLLEQRIPELNLRRVTLAQAFEALRAMTGANIFVSWRDMKLPPDTKVTLHVWNVTLDQALTAILHVAGWTGPIPWAVRDGVIVVDRPSDLGVGTSALRVYDLRRMLSLRRGSDPAGLAADSEDGFDVPADRPGALIDNLSRLLELSVEPASWPQIGGTDGAKSPFGLRLIITQTPEAHRQIAELFNEMLLTCRAGDASPSPSPLPQPAVDRNADLAQRIAELNLSSTTLQGAIEAIRAQTHANLIVHWEHLVRDDVSRTARIRLHLRDVTLDQALAAVITGAGGKYPDMRMVKDGMIVIDSAEEIHDGSSVLHVYDVNDLIDRICKHLPPPHGATGPASSTIPSEMAYNPRAEAAESLAQLIEDSIDPQSWPDHGSTAGMVRDFGGVLVILQNPPNHRKIVDFLRTLRADPAKLDGLTTKR